MSSDNSTYVLRCRAKLKRVELLFKPEEYAEIIKAAKGAAVAAYIKEAVREKIQKGEA